LLDAGQCSDGQSGIINLDETDAVSSSAPYLQFIDGVSAKDPLTLFTDCPAAGGAADPVVDDPVVVDDDRTPCCKGGVSFLKTEFDGEDFGGGTITLNTTIASKNSDCVLDWTLSLQQVRFRPFFKPLFVDCDDECLLDPFSGVACTSFDDTIAVKAGDDLCVAYIDPETGGIRFDEKFPTDLFLYYFPDNDSSSAFVGRIHTSCSKPVSAPFGQTLVDACASDYPPPFDTENVGNGTQDLPFVKFLDGVSVDYYEAAVAAEIGVDISSLFDISFDGCGCRCQNASSTNPTPPPPTDNPTLELSESPAPPSVAGGTTPPPTTPPTTFAFQEIQCEQECLEYVYNNCVVVSQGVVVEEHCLPPFPFDGFFRSLASTLEDQIRFHRKMGAVYRKALLMIEGEAQK